MYEFFLPKVLAEYGLKYFKIFECQKGYRNEIWPVLASDGRMLNVTFFKREVGITDRIRRADAVSEYLALLGMPTRKRIDQRILMLKNETLTTHVSVYNYLPGSTIPWEAYTMSHIKLLGRTMSDMHANLSQMPTTSLPSVYKEYKQIIERMNVYFSKSSIKKAIRDKLNLEFKIDLFENYQTLLKEYAKKPNQQALHMDFVRGNILFDNGSISGILDFEKTAVGHTVVDVARTLAFLLVDCKYKTADKVNKYFLYSGYQKRGLNKDIGDDAARDQLVEMFLFYDFYKFLLHNPYESLHLNEHYARTKDILVKRGVIFL
jgi:Ser/Thr protein kinase RdoA (MazF antagonist)